MKLRRIKTHFLLFALALCTLFATSAKGRPTQTPSTIYDYRVSWEVTGGGYMTFLQIENIVIVSSPSSSGYGNYLFPVLPWTWIYYVAIPVGKAEVDYAVLIDHDACTFDVLSIIE